MCSLCEETTTTFEACVDGDCTTVPPELPCEGNWTRYTDCSETCGIGTKTKTYSIIQEAENGGNECPFQDDELIITNCIIIIHFYHSIHNSLSPRDRLSLLYS